MPSLPCVAVALPETDQSVRGIEDDDNQHDTEDELPGIGEVSGRVEAHALEYRRSREGSKSVGAAPEDRNEDELARFGPIAEFGRGDLLNDRHQRAADAAEKCRDHIPDEQDATGRRPQIFEPGFVRLDGTQHVSKWAMEIALYPIKRANRDQETHIKDDVLEGFGRERKPKQGRPRDSDAIRTTGVVEHLFQQRP